MTDNILVIGGTGKTGSRVVKKLQHKKQQVRVGSRNGQPPFDWEKPETWTMALQGVDKVYITFQPDLAVPGALQAIEGLMAKAQEQQIKKVVLLSGKGEREAELCEQIVINSPINHTIIRASWFMENFSESFFLDSIVSGEVALPKANAKVPYVSANDIAEVAVHALLDDSLNGKTFELTGPDVLTFEEVVSQIAQATNRTITFTPITLTAYTDMMKEHQVPDGYIWLINYLFSEVLDAEGNNEITTDIKMILGREPKPFAQYVIETAKTGVWNR